MQIQRRRQFHLGTTHKTILSIIILLVLAIGSSTIYVFMSDSAKPQTSVTSNATDSAATQLPPPPKPAANAKEGVAVEGLISPVSAGANSSITVTTNAGSTCTILVTYNNKPAADSGLVAKTADNYGNVSWSWTVDSAAPVGKWPVKVTCNYNGRSGVVESDLQVTH